jgi:LacI family transcriptional regulator
VPMKSRASKKRVTVRTVADAAGVSTATVSRVFSPAVSDAVVSPHVRERVLKAAKELKYIPSRLPQVLRSGWSGLVTFSIPCAGMWDQEWLHHVYDFQPVLSYIGGYSMILLASLEKRHRDMNVLFSFRQPDRPFTPKDYKMDLVDGIFYASPNIGESVAFERIHQTGFPLVLDTLLPDHPEFYCVGGDNYDTAYKAVQYLYRIGRRRIRFVNPSRLENPITREHVRGYEQAMADAGLEPLIPLLFGFSDYHQNPLSYALRALQDDGGGVDGLIIGFTLTAKNIIEDLKRAGVAVPEDVSVICLGDRIECQICDPPITVLGQPTALVFSEGLDLLREVIEGKNVRERRRVIAPELIVRKSCGGSPDAGAFLRDTVPTQSSAPRIEADRPSRGATIGGTDP